MDPRWLELLLPALGVLAGALTTVAGMGGGLCLVLALSLASSPAVALAATAPALLIGNLHRAASGATHVDRRVAVAVAAGALPGSVVGGFAAAALPAFWLKALLVATTAYAVARSLKLVDLSPPKAALTPAGFGIGAAAATTSGAGLLLSPLLLSSGLTGEAYVATSAVIAASMHVGRVVAYGASGLLSANTLVMAAILTAAILAGNLAGSRLRRYINAPLASRIEIGALLACVALALLGLSG